MIKLTTFYDGTCPLCAKEIASLAVYDNDKQIRAVDIYSESFSEYPHIDPQKANTILHALDEKGELILGLDVTHRAWQLVGRGWLYAPLRWPLIKPVADRGYLYFAKNRYRFSFWLTGQSRCDSGTCQ